MRRSFRPTAIVLTVAAAVALPVQTTSAQATSPKGGSILYLLETEGRLTPGQEARGALSSSDYISIRDSYLDAWALEGRVGTRVTIDLMSEEFDGYLYLVGPGFAETLSDDDSGPGCDARISVTLLEDGLYRVVASSTGGRQTGVYALLVSEGDAPRSSYPCGGIDPEALRSLPTDGRSLAFGDTAYGRLSDSDERMEGRPIQAWALRGEAGQTVSVLLLSDAFDSYLYLLGPGLDEPLTDDDGAGDLDSKIDFTFPETGTYTIVASALSRGDVGSFTLIVGESRNVTEIEALPFDGRAIGVGEPMVGFLSRTEATFDNRPAQAWAFAGDRGMRIEINMTSDEFDTYLFFTGPGMGRALSNDDGGDEQNSRIVVTLQEAGTYIIVASAFSSGGSGPYELRVTVRE